MTDVANDLELAAALEEARQQLERPKMPMRPQEANGTNAVSGRPSVADDVESPLALAKEARPQRGDLFAFIDEIAGADRPAGAAPGGEVTVHPAFVPGIAPPASIQPLIVRWEATRDDLAAARAALEAAQQDAKRTQRAEKDDMKSAMDAGEADPDDEASEAAYRRLRRAGRKVTAAVERVEAAAAAINMEIMNSCFEIRNDGIAVLQDIDARAGALVAELRGLIEDRFNVLDGIGQVNENVARYIPDELRITEALPADHKPGEPYVRPRSADQAVKAILKAGVGEVAREKDSIVPLLGTVGLWFTDVPMSLDQPVIDAVDAVLAPANQANAPEWPPAAA